MIIIGARGSVVRLGTTLQVKSRGLDCRVGHRISSIYLILRVYQVQEILA
jgi:hypothetical protein